MKLIDERKMSLAKMIKIDGITTEELYEILSITQESEHGDYTLPCFKLAKIFRKSPVEIANDLKEKVQLTREFSAVEAVGGYLNFMLNKEILTKKLLSEIIEKKENYGKKHIGKGKVICVDYSSVNIAKPFHMGHLASTAIGAALYRMYKFLGFAPIGINHLGDWGTQFGKLIVAYKKWSGEHENLGIDELNLLYVKFHDEAQEDESLENEARIWFKKIENGDAEALEIFHKFKEITLNHVKKIYTRLNVDFDSWDGESFYNDKMDEIIKKLGNLNLIEESDGAKIVNLDKYNMPPCLLVKADGATLYATRDLAAAFYRKNTYDFFKSLYVVAYQQNLHFKQFFKVIELMGESWYKDLVHVQFGMVSLESGALSTRKGNVVWLEDVLNKSVEKAYNIITEKNPNLSNKADVAEMVGVGAVTYSALNTARIKDTVFSYDKVLSFEGETGPYLQYSNARCESILRKVENLTKVLDRFENEKLEALADTYSVDLIRLLDKFSFVINDSLEKYEPYILARYLIDIAKAFNKFYMENSVLNIEKSYRNPRIALVYATHIVLKNGLDLLGIKAPSEM